MLGSISFNAIIDERIINHRRKHMSQTIDVKRYEELARQKQGEHRKFLAQLKKKAPKNFR